MHTAKSWWQIRCAQALEGGVDCAHGHLVGLTNPRPFPPRSFVAVTLRTSASKKEIPATLIWPCEQPLLSGPSVGVGVRGEREQQLRSEAAWEGQPNPPPQEVVHGNQPNVHARLAQVSSPTRRSQMVSRGVVLHSPPLWPDENQPRV